ncbi:hypothetical protein BCV69DRAFT_135994 [Microstroma glucosiphilum]|uniref:Uncharacterized protein n=1 Tax=Pseudomicrostroma glucosiphilum TaxID=1684307 RepID=A0A316UAE7_9BASI|nr:hypothetical protein BCV69DRAFT_135994 [Pseudomicrostroma glucosiphilum]PWN22200.1 hypothetical protein BCV69DRAFT_135994 [Pseudomicrostroma glucosiphilum]
MDASRSSMSTRDLDGALAQAARQVELARQEHLYLQQEHERLRLRQRLARERGMEQSDREAHREATRPAQGGREGHQDTTADNSAQQRDHPVYLLNCKGCGSFLSDRGMKAILLLKPHVTLFSTDVMPSNVGPLYPASYRNADRSLTRSASSSAHPAERQVERTCDCLTETLGCYGCGAQIGYHIISPCARCTASVTDQKKGSNGHRTVLHCSEITARERRYVPGEAGVRCAPTPCPFPQNTNKDRKLASSIAHGGYSNAVMNTFHWGRGSPLTRDNAPFDRYARPARRNVRMVHIDRSGPFHIHRQRMNGIRPEEIEDDLSDGDEFLDLDLAAPEEDEVELQMQLDTDLYDELEQDKFDVGGGRARALSAASLVREQRRQQAAAAAAAASKSGGSGMNSARLLERGAVVYWGDLVPGGERCQPFDSDLALQVPVAVR